MNRFMNRFTNRSMMAGFGAIAICVSALVMLFSSGRSLASFSASQPLGRNQLTTARADLVIGQPASVALGQNMAPGDRRTVQLLLSNAGSLPLKVFAQPVADQRQPDDQAPDDVFEVELWQDSDCDAPPSETGTQSLPIDDTPIEELASTPDGIQLDVGQISVVCVSVLLPLSAPNSMQGSTNSQTVTFTAIHDIERS